MHAFPRKPLYVFEAVIVCIRNRGSNRVCTLYPGALTRSPLGIEALQADPSWYGPTKHGEPLLYYM